MLGTIELGEDSADGINSRDICRRANCSKGHERPPNRSTRRYRHKAIFKSGNSRLLFKFASRALLYST